MGPNRHAVNTLGYSYTGQTARERLLLHMGMVERPGAEDRAVGSKDIPLVGIMVPPCGLVGQGNSESIRMVTALFHVNGYHVGFSCANVPKGKEHEKHKNNMPSHLLSPLHAD